MLRRIMVLMVGERGTVLLLSLVVLGVAFALVAPVLTYASGLFPRFRTASEGLVDFYSADAGIEHGMWRIAEDPVFLGKLIDAEIQGLPAPAYTFPVNGQNTSVTVSSYVPRNPPPEELPEDRVSSNGLAPFIQTRFICDGAPCAAINLAKIPKVRLMILINNGGAAQSTITELAELLPPGFRYKGNLRCGTDDIEGSGLPLGEPLCDQPGLVQGTERRGKPFPVSELEPPALGITGPPATWSVAGPDPFHGCEDKTATQVDQQLLFWEWRGGRGTNAPRVPPRSTANISFDIGLPEPLGPGSYRDSPWGYITEQQCGGNRMQAGKQASLQLYVTAKIVAKDQDGNVTATAWARISDTAKLEGYIIEER